MKKTSIRRDIFLFLKSPDYRRFNDLSTKEKITILIKVLILTHIALFLVNIPILLLEKLDVISKIPMKTDFFLNSIEAKNVNYKPYFILATIFTVPFWEEISFRLFLTKFHLNYFIISVSIILGMFIYFFLVDIFWIPKSYLLMSIMGSVYILIISSLIGGAIYFFRNKIKKIEEFWNKNTGLIIYSVATLFAIGHINNLKLENRDLVFLPLVLFPFLVYGLSFGYLRVRLGIIYSIAQHFIFLTLRFGLPELLILLKPYAHQSL
jgi:membrane protease YdiL (CAAX protease family)